MGIVFFLPLCLYSQEVTRKNIKIENLEKHLNFLASNRLEGRSFGTKFQGLDSASTYIRNEIELYGLLPADSDYFQHFTISSITPDLPNTQIQIFNSKGKRIYKTDSLAIVFAKTDTLLKASEIVFAGFGTVDEKTGQNDYVGLDIKGKIVMISTGSSEMLTNEIPFSWNGVAETKEGGRCIQSGSCRGFTR